MADKFGIRSRRRRYYFRTFNGKVNFARQLRSGRGPRRKASSSTTATTSGGDPVRAAPRQDYLTPEAIAAIKIAVSKGEWREDVRAGMWVGKAIGQVLKLDLETKKGLIKKVLVTLFQTGVLKVEPEGTSIAGPCCCSKSLSVSVCRSLCQFERHADDPG